MSSSSLPSSSYVCDTIPAARLATGSGEIEPKHPMDFDTSTVHDESETPSTHSLKSEQDSGSPPPPRKLCVRHQRMADEGTNLKLQQVCSARVLCETILMVQQSLDALPLEEREVVNAIWSSFSSSSHPRRAIILQGLLTMCCFSQLSLLTEQLGHLIRIDPFTVFPREVSLKVLGYLDATSLCRAAQVTRKWKSLADDDVLWRGICEQHIGQKCHKCGWGLPVLDKKRPYVQSGSPCPSPDIRSQKRTLEDTPDLQERPLKRQRSEPRPVVPDKAVMALAPPAQCEPESSCSILTSTSSQSSSSSATRPWKDVYSERMTIERNWRRGRCTVRTLKGHSDGVMCLQFSETLSHPHFPVLITGSYDRTARVWNLETGVELHCLKGHTRAVRALQFDEVKLITGSMDTTLKVWDWRRGRCIRTLSGHTEGVVCLNFDSNVLASGSVDSTIKVWNLRTGGAFTLRGHSDWVNSVQLWDSNLDSTPSASSSPLVFDVPGCAAPQIDPGKMLFSASDDGTIKLWDLTLRTCVRQFTGHVGQVQSMKLLLADECEDETQGAGPDDTEEADPSQETSTIKVSPSTAPSSTPSSPTPSGDVDSSSPSFLSPNRKKPVLISGSLDNTIKVWDIDTGKTVRTFFGHLEGVWSVASDKMRLVSGSHDRTIKVCTTYWHPSLSF